MTGLHCVRVNDIHVASGTAGPVFTLPAILFCHKREHGLQGPATKDTEDSCLTTHAIFLLPLKPLHIILFDPKLFLQLRAGKDTKYKPLTVTARLS